MTTDLVVSPRGVVRCLYDETLDLSTLGAVHIQRASHVEPKDSGGGWMADLNGVAGPKLGPFPRRSTALEAEITWLRQHWLMALPQTRDG